VVRRKGLTANDGRCPLINSASRVWYVGSDLTALSLWALTSPSTTHRQPGLSITLTHASHHYTTYHPVINMALLHNELTRTMSQPTSDSNGSADTTTMNPDLTADSTSPIIPSCGTCKKPLEPSVDKHKTKYSFWRNCKTCRDKQTSAKRKANGLPPKEATTIKKRKDAVRPAQEQPREVHVNVDRSHDFATRSSLTGFDEIIEEHSAQTEIMQEVATAVTAKEEEGNVSYANDQESAIQDRECSVCAESFPVQDFPSLIACSHEANVCRTCFLAWIDQCMASTTWDQFSCPSSDCTSLISHSDVKIYAPTDVFTRCVYSPPISATNTYLLQASTNFLCAASSAMSPISSTALRKHARQAKFTTPVLQDISSAAMHVDSASAHITSPMYPFTMKKHARNLTSVLQGNVRRKSKPSAADKKPKKLNKRVWLRWKSRRSNARGVERILRRMVDVII
jgi:hypothetical protein